MAMAVNERLTIGVVYKPEYDTEGDYPELTAWSKTFTRVKETATLDQQYAAIHGFMSLTTYKDAPYVRKHTITADLTV